MPQSYTPEFKEKIVRLRLEEGRTIHSITIEYDISKETIRRWCNEFNKECQAKSLQNPSCANEAEIMKENLRLRRELEEKEKEILFLKKAAAFFAKEID
ncbi:MAG: transposase [Clostridiales bacterium]|nr:transposase [Clostridiales bacterium]